MWAHLGATLAHLGAMLAHLGPMLGPSGADVGASWGYVGATWGYVGRSCAMFVQKHVEWHRAKKHCNGGSVDTHTLPRGRRQGGPAYITFGYHRRPSGQHTGVQAGARI